jgi:hypothetical protein
MRLSVVACIYPHNHAHPPFHKEIIMYAVAADETSGSLAPHAPSEGTESIKLIIVRASRLMFTLMAAPANLRCSTKRREQGQDFGRSGCDVLARGRAGPASKDSSSHEGDAMGPSWRQSHLLALAHASIGRKAIIWEQDHVPQHQDIVQFRPAGDR